MSLGESLCKLPPEIITTILLKLPTKSIVRCRYVCKSLRDLISTPYFAHLHFSKAPPSLLLFPATSYSLSNVDKPIDFCWYDMKHHGRDHNHVVLSFDTKFNLPTGQGATIVGSCNGLLCLSKVFLENRIYICNPITGEYVVIPPPKLKVGSRVQACPSDEAFAFYHSSQSKLCKILIIRYPYHSNHEIVGEIFTLGRSHSWRNIEIPFNRFHYDPRYRSASVNGAIHWIAQDHQNPSLYVCSFDMENEQVRRIALPDDILDQYNGSHNIGLVAFGNSLCAYVRRHGCLDVWVMEEYGAKDSWRRKRFDVDVSCNNQLQIRTLEVEEDGSILIFLTGHVLSLLISYDPKTKKSREINMGCHEMGPGAVVYTPSFVSLKDVLIEKYRGRVLNVN